MTEKLEYDPTGAPLFRMVGNQAIYFVGPFATVTATANAGCTGYGCPQGVINVKAAVHVILAGSRIATVRASNVLYYHRDWQGSVVATTYTGGNVGVKYRYTPYGQLDKVEGVDAANGSELGYTGGLRLGWNPSTGARQGDLLLLGARVYDAALKRWLQPDTVDLLRYTYTDGDPVNLTDPTGRTPLGSDAKDRVCLGGWCVNPVTATFFMERTFGYCTGAAACQLMLGDAEHERRTANSIADYQRRMAWERAMQRLAAITRGLQSILDDDIRVQIPVGRQVAFAPALPLILLEGGTVLKAFAIAFGIGAIGACAVTGCISFADSGPQDKKLSDGEIEALKKAGIDPHDLKSGGGGRPPANFDLFKNKNGDIFVKPKDGRGPGEPTWINIYEVLRKLSP